MKIFSLDIGFCLPSRFPFPCTILDRPSLFALHVELLNNGKFFIFDLNPIFPGYGTPGNSRGLPPGGVTNPAKWLHVDPQVAESGCMSCPNLQPLITQSNAEVESIKPFGLLIIFNIKVSYYENGRLEEILPISSYRHTEIKPHYCYLIGMKKYNNTTLIRIYRI